MNHPGEIAPLSHMARPDVVVVTTVAPAHLEAFDSIEGIAHEKASRMDGLRVGDPLDKCIDMGAIVHPQQLARITDMVSASAADIYRAATPIPNGCYYPPTLITGLSTASPLMQEEIFGPVLVAMTFRTPEEAVLLANNTRYGLAASVWSENINLALDIAPKLVAGVVWVNGTNMFDAAAGFGGMRESGFGREGGWEGLLAYLRPKTQGKPLAQARANFPAPTSTEGMDRTAKLFIGGKQARPDGGYSQAITTPKGKLLGEVGIGNRKDVRGAVEAAHAAKGWGKATAHNRAQVRRVVKQRRRQVGPHHDRMRVGCQPDQGLGLRVGREHHLAALRQLRLQLGVDGVGEKDAGFFSHEQRVRKAQRLGASRRASNSRESPRRCAWSSSWSGPILPTLKYVASGCAR
jgi:hypothetical protein